MNVYYQHEYGNVKDPNVSDPMGMSRPSLGQAQGNGKLLPWSKYGY